MGLILIVLIVVVVAALTISRRKFLTGTAVTLVGVVLKFPRTLGIGRLDLAMTEFGFFPGNNWAGTLATLGKDQVNALDCEANLGRKITVQRRYCPAGASGLDMKTRDALEHGRKVYVEFATAATATSNWKLGASGQLDSWMHGLATTYAPFADKLYVVIHHEPDIDRAGNGTPEEFKAFFKRFSGILRATAPFKIVANQTKNAFHSSNTYWTPDPADFDYFGLDSYNMGSKWRLFADLFDEGYAYAGSIGKPFCVGETGCKESTTNSKANWFTDSGAWVKAHPNTAFVEYTHHFAGNVAKNNCVTTSPTSAAAFVALSKTLV